MLTFVLQDVVRIECDFDQILEVLFGHKLLCLPLNCFSTTPFVHTIRGPTPATFRITLRRYVFMWNYGPIAHGIV